MEKLKSNWEKIKEKKKEWLNFYKENDKYKNVNMQVLEFIAEITFFPNLDCTSDGCIDHLFLNLRYLNDNNLYLEYIVLICDHQLTALLQQA